MRVASKRILSIGLSFLFLLGTLLVYFNLIAPEIASISKLRSEVISKENVYTVQKNAVDKVGNLIAQYKNIEQLQKTVALAMPSGVDVIGGLRQIQASAVTQGVTLSSLNFRTASPNRIATQTFIKRLGTVGVNITAKGTYAQLKGFIQLIETSVRVANVTTFKYHPGTKDSIDTMDVDVDIYYQEQ